MDFSIWYLLGAALVFWMQAGFAMVEAGFTRAKNAGNIIMKNLMDFCIGTVVFIVLGYGIMNSDNYIGGLIGIPEYSMFTNFENFDWSNFVFQLVFCATCATIVSGAMAERTKFSMYCIYSAVISAVVYPIEAGWIWNGAGWLNKLGFVDFAGSCVIHMVGGITALIGAAVLGPRIGKYSKRTGKPHAIPGHNLPLGALGVFILWFGWYGFNGAAATDIDHLARIFATTTLAPAFATVAVMIFTWIKYGKPDVSMSLNGSLAGLVAITAGCDSVDGFGAIVIGICSGLICCFGVWFVEKVLKVDDPVGAVAVHGCNGIFGTIAVGLFAVYTDSPVAGCQKGLFYGGGFHQLGVQCLGVVVVAAYAAVVMGLVFFVMNKVWGLRVTAEEELRGLDVTEHGLPSAYTDFMPAGNMFYSAGTSVETLKGEVPMEKAVEVVRASDGRKPAAYKEISETKQSVPKITKLSIVCQQSKFDDLKEAMNAIGVSGITVTQVLGCGTQKGLTTKYRGTELDVILLPKMKVEVIVSAVPVEKVIETARKALYTGNIGDGKIFVYDVENVVKVRTGEEGFEALQGEN